MTRFVGRTAELAALEEWWSSPFPRPALIWGRRRVGKTVLIERFSTGKRVVFHTAARRPTKDELTELSHRVAAVAGDPLRDLRLHPYERWEDLLEALGAAARDEPLLLVLDEFPELMAMTPALPGILRAFLDRSRGHTQLRILICGSSVRTMEAIQEYREPLYGRFDLTLLLHPFRPHEAAAMLPDLAPAERALVYGIVGGMPQYLEWWNQSQPITANLRRLACRPGSLLLTEGDRVLGSEVESGDLPAAVLYAIASGKTKYQEIADAVRAEPSRTLDRLLQMRLIERLIPVTEDPRRTRKRIYRIADNFLAFYLGVLEHYRAEIERGLGETIVREIVTDLDDHMGGVYEDAFRDHLRRLAVLGELGPSVTAVGPWWKSDGQDQIDAVVLGRRDGTTVPILAGEAKWAREVDGTRLVHKLAVKASALPGVPDSLRYAVCARESIVHAPPELLCVTAADIFTPGEGA
ncbi:ATP-binding protein [Thermoactinospora rubra]|uniref:ATP-binding protein n=1 Tax=Thermoactinospora rubra TaxID=1088767 RepID=UPI00197CD3A5|nr:ATP-binding protein [Thermoactinospora rubra]